VTASRLRLERLGPEHDLNQFSSGDQVLDTWLKNHGLTAQQMGSARPFVLLDADDIRGYFSLTMGSLLRTEAPAKLVRGLPAYPVGAVLLVRLAVDRRSQGRGLGSLLLSEALRKAVALERQPRPGSWWSMPLTKLLPPFTFGTVSSACRTTPRASFGG
jgi:GNAT superfamily N-acetyltransferase